MQRRTILALAIFAAAMIAGAGYLISSTEECLFQPSVTEGPPGEILFKVRHAKQNPLCVPDCDHDCSNNDGTIKVEVYQRGIPPAPDTRTHGPYPMSKTGEQDCYKEWTARVEVDISDDDYVLFYHDDDRYPDCQCTIDLD